MTKNEQIEDASKTKVNTAFLIEALVLMAVLIASMAVFTVSSGSSSRLATSSSVGSRDCSACMASRHCSTR